MIARTLIRVALLLLAVALVLFAVRVGVQFIVIKIRG